MVTNTFYRSQRYNILIVIGLANKKDGDSGFSLSPSILFEKKYYQNGASSSASASIPLGKKLHPLSVFVLSGIILSSKYPLSLREKEI